MRGKKKTFSSSEESSGTSFIKEKALRPQRKRVKKRANPESPLLKKGWYLLDRPGVIAWKEEPGSHKKKKY